MMDKKTNEGNLQGKNKIQREALIEEEQQMNFFERKAFIDTKVGYEDSNKHTQILFHQVVARAGKLFWAFWEVRTQAQTVILLSNPLWKTSTID